MELNKFITLEILHRHVVYIYSRERRKSRNFVRKLNPGSNELSFG